MTDFALAYTGNRPTQANEHDAGYDLRADVSTPVTLWAGETKTIPTGLRIALPENVAALVVSRSGLAAKSGVHVLNSPGLIDSGYRGEIQVILRNSSTNSRFVVGPGDRIAQLMFVPVVHPEWIAADFLDDTGRGENGIGSSGVA